MDDAECVALLQWALPRLRLRWPGFRKVRRQVCKRIRRRLAELGLTDPADYRARLEADPAEWSVLDSCCRVTVSRFCRDRQVFERLGTEVLPELARAVVRGKQPWLRVWSAGCGSGEEPFSVKLVWELAGRPRPPGACLRVTATDVDRRLLERAERACYPASALRDLPAGWMEEAFEPSEAGYRLRGEFREGVEFRRQDIRQRLASGPFEMILCRNLVFTYFEEALQREILPRMVARLVPGGILVIGQHESLPAERSTALAGWPGGPACVYRKPA